MHTQAEAIKEIRKIAKENGLTFKRGNGTINNKPFYRFCERSTNVVVLDNQSFWTAYEDCVSGYIDKLMGNGPKPPVIITCEEYSICDERCWIVKIDEVTQNGGYLDSGELVSAIGSKRAELVITNKAQDYRWIENQK